MKRLKYLITREYLTECGWVDKGDIMVRYSTPRLGWKDDGTLIVGYNQWPDKVKHAEDLNEILKCVGLK